MKKHKITNERREELRNLKKYASSLKQENLRALQMSGLKRWERETIEYNIDKLKEIISECKYLSSKEEVNSYVDAKISSENPSLIYEACNLNITLSKLWRGAILYPQIARYSTVYSVGYDLNWLTDGTILQHFSIANGSDDLKILADEFLENNFDKIEGINRKYISNHYLYKDFFRVIQSILDRTKENDYLSSNIICMTTIEGLVRRLNYFIYKKQNVNSNEDDSLAYAYTEFTSLESLIMKSRLNDDYPVSILEANRLSQYQNDKSLIRLNKILDRHKKAKIEFEKFISDVETLPNSVANLEEGDPRKEKLRIELERISSDVVTNFVDLSDNKFVMSIRVKLFFLVRRLKEFRNQLMHGQFIDFDTKVRNYVILSALLKVLNLLEDYDKIYLPK